MSKLLSDKKKIPKQTPAKWNVSPISEATSPQKKIKSVTFEDVQPPTSAKRRNIREKHQNRNLVKTSHGRRTEVKRRKTRKKKEKKKLWRLKWARQEAARGDTGGRKSRKKYQECPHVRILISGRDAQHPRVLKHSMQDTGGEEETC